MKAIQCFLSAISTGDTKKQEHLKNPPKIKKSKKKKSLTEIEPLQIAF